MRSAAALGIANHQRRIAMGTNLVRTSPHELPVSTPPPTPPSSSVRGLQEESNSVADRATSASISATAVTPRRSRRIELYEPTIRDQLRMDAAERAAPRRRTRALVLVQRANRQNAVPRSDMGESLGPVNSDSNCNTDNAETSSNALGSEEEARQDEEGARGETQDGYGRGETSESDEDSDQDYGEMPPGYVPSEQDVHAAPPQRYHQSWDAWQDYLEEYCEQTLQVIVVKETLGLAEQNRRIQRTKKFKDGERSLLAPEWNPYQRFYICTHGWSGKSRGTGKRPRQHIRSTDCEFRFSVQAGPVRHRRPNGPWHLAVKCGWFVHNHPITSDTYGTYPIARGIVDPVVEAKVDGMLTAGAKRSKIYDYLLDQGENVFQRDIDNMVTNHISTVTTTNDNDATAVEITKFASASPDNVVSIEETSKLETGVLSLTTKTMRQLYARFPELLLVDCTHKTNR
jgi:hypothetical protein